MKPARYLVAILVILFWLVIGLWAIEEKSVAWILIAALMICATAFITNVEEER